MRSRVGRMFLTSSRARKAMISCASAAVKESDHLGSDNFSVDFR
jgi:hypothetical protein